MVKKRSIIALVIIAVVGLLIFYNLSEHSVLGTNAKGYITKDVYNHYGSSDKKIAIINGMHPREELSATIVPYVIKFYAITHNVEIVNYKVTVTDNPDVFTTGRNNGESLVATYAIPDIKKSEYDLVIICHDHEEGYGEGYYIATPSMDGKSVRLAEAVHQILTDFNYYQRDTSKSTQSTSITRVDNPITNTGTPVFVYEIPENDGYFNSFYDSKRLVDASFNVL
jgi:hypothetical protein